MTTMVRMSGHTRRPRIGGMKTRRTRRKGVKRLVLTPHRFGVRHTEECAIAFQEIQRFNEESGAQCLSAGGEHGQLSLSRRLLNLAPSQSVRVQKGILVLIGFLVFLNILWVCYRSP